MGNRPGLITIDIETSNICGEVYASPVKNPLIFMGGGLMSRWIPNPEFAGTPWEDTSRMTKREVAVAKLHTFLAKLDVLKLDEVEFEKLRLKSIKRLRRAKWAQYKNLKRG